MFFSSVLSWRDNMACNRALLNTQDTQEWTKSDPEATESPSVTELVLFHPSQSLGLCVSYLCWQVQRSGGTARIARQLQIVQGLCLKARHITRVQGFISAQPHFRSFCASHRPPQWIQALEIVSSISASLRVT